MKNLFIIFSTFISLFFFAMTLGSASVINVAHAGPLSPVLTNTNTKPNTNTNPDTNSAPSTSSVVAPKIDDPFQGRGLLAISLRIIDFLLYIIVIVAVIVIIIAGFRMVTGGGNPAAITAAKKSIIWALIGVVVAIMSFAIVSIIQKFIA